MINNMKFGPFADYMKMFTDNNMWSNMFNQQNKGSPSMMDMNGMMSMQKRNAEAMSAANQMMMENAQSFMRRQAEIVQAGAADAFQMVKELAISPNPEVSMNKQMHFMKSVVEAAVSNAREMGEMVAKSHLEVFDVLGKRMSDSVSECNHFSSAPSGKKKAA